MKKVYVSPVGKGNTLDSGMTVNVAEAYSTPDYLNSGDLKVNKDEKVRVIIVYDGQHLLYDKDVIAL